MLLHKLVQVTRRDSECLLFTRSGQFKFLAWYDYKMSSRISNKQITKFDSISSLLKSHEFEATSG